MDDLVFQIVMTGALIGYIVLVIGAMVHIRRQQLSERDLLVWDVLILMVPLGAVLAFAYFPPRNGKKKKNE